MGALTGTKFQQFMCDNTPLSLFKKLIAIVSTPRLFHCLHRMCLAMAAPKGLKDPKCKKITLHKCPLIPYAPEKDRVQETVSALKADSLKTQISEGAKL
jgi:hypothetical protein